MHETHYLEIKIIYFFATYLPYFSDRNKRNIISFFGLSVRFLHFIINISDKLMEDAVWNIFISVDSSIFKRVIIGTFVCFVLVHIYLLLFHSKLTWRRSSFVFIRYRWLKIYYTCVNYLLVTLCVFSSIISGMILYHSWI